MDLEALRQIKLLLGDSPKPKDLLIECLHKIQDKYYCISYQHLEALTHYMQMSQAEVFEVATFYHHFDVVKDDALNVELAVRVCESITCDMFGSNELLASLQKTLPNHIKIKKVPCVGRCDKAPIAIVGDNPIEFATPEKITSAATKKQIVSEELDPINYNTYIKTDGYSTYQKCVNNEYDAENILTILKESNLRGLGGAGFPVGRKWGILRANKANKLMAVNIDEGEPGTFKDKYYLEKDPHRFLEGMLIAAWVTKIDEIYIYIRDEYTAIRKMLIEEINVLQKNIENLPKIHLRRGAGAYICGEESAMIESIEGKRGLPRLRPPFVAAVGLFGKPTLEHNMESLYWVRDIVEHGAKYFTQHGRNGRVGFRSFSVSGRVKKTGVFLAPAGITIRQLIDEYCGGMMDGEELYAYMPGGASGGILPASLDYIPLDFDTLQEYGCFIGSAAIIIISDKYQVKDLAVNIIDFFKKESCGQCTPCRVGTKKMLNLIQQEKWDKNLLQDLSQVMADASICGLGQAAPNPVLCTMKYFSNELS